MEYTTGSRGLNDADLLRGCIAGEKTAWGVLVRRHVGLMHAMAARVLGTTGEAGPLPEAEDAVQAVFLKLWEDGRRRLRSFQGRSRLSTWLVAVTRREALDRLRRDHRRQERTVEAGRRAIDRLREDLRNGAPSLQEARAAAREQASGFGAAVAHLPARDRLLVRLVYEDGCSYREAAAVLQANENSIGPWLRRAQDRLRTALEPEANG